MNTEYTMRSTIPQTRLCRAIFGVIILLLMLPQPVSAAGSKVPPDAAVSKVSSGKCSALLPTGWTMQTDPRSQEVAAFSSDRRSYVGWSMIAINSTLQPYWKAYGNDPDLYSPVPASQAMGMLRTVAKTYLGHTSPFTKVGPEVAQGMYKASKVQSTAAVGLIVWADQPPPGDGVTFNYIAIQRTVLAPKGTSDNTLLRMMRNALSITCSVQLVSSPDAFSPSSTLKRAKKSGGNQYNSQLDSFWAHDPDTGQNYSLTNSDLVSTGCGSGNTVAVKLSGNRCIELAPGRSA